MVIPQLQCTKVWTVAEEMVDSLRFLPITMHSAIVQLRPGPDPCPCQQVNLTELYNKTNNLLWAGLTQTYSS